MLFVEFIVNAKSNST